MNENGNERRESERQRDREEDKKGWFMTTRKKHTNKLSLLNTFQAPLLHAAMQNFDSIFVYSFVAKLCCSIFLSRDISVCVCVYNICPAGYTNFITFYANWWFCYCCCCHYFCYYYCCSLLLSQMNVFGIFSLSRGNCQ